MVATSGRGGHFDGVALIYIGGATASRSILIAGAVIIPSVIFCQATMKIFAPGLRSPMLPGANRTSGGPSYPLTISSLD